MLRVSVTVGFAVATLYAIQLGSQELTRRADAAPTPDAAPIVPVATTEAAIETGYMVKRSFIGQVEPRRTSAVSFELSGRLDDILVDEGDTIFKGQAIATLDTRLLAASADQLEARRDALEAQLRFAEKTAERQSRLNVQGFASQAALDETLSRSDELRARIAEVSAALVTNALQVEKSQVNAPFDGQVTQRRVDGGESISPGQPLVEIVEAGVSQIRIGVPLDVTAEDLADASVEVAGVPYSTDLVTLRPDVDPVTRTRTALFDVVTNDILTFGQTARLLLSERIEANGLWVPVTSLKEGLRGQWTVLAVNADNTVRALSVQVLHADGDAVFVQGAFPQNTRLIISGPQRVTVGQTVAPHPAT